VFTPGFISVLVVYVGLDNTPKTTYISSYVSLIMEVMVIMPNKLKNMDEQRLLKLYSELMEELRDRELIRSSNNPVADYAEKIAVEYMRLTRVGKEERGYDAIDESRRKYQIKGRRVTRHNSSRQLSVIRDLDKRLFDYLVAVIFNEDFSANEIWNVPYRFVKENSRFSKHQNGHIFIANTELLSPGRGVERVR
jgi:hypothetical protein